MAVVKVWRTYEDSGDSKSESRSYRVQVNSLADSSSAVRSANDGTTAIPSDGTILSGTTWRSKSSAKRSSEDPLVWDVTVTFAAADNREAQPPEEGGQTNAWNITIQSRAVPYDKQVYKDAANNDIKNKAGYPLQEQPTITDYDAEYVVSYNTIYGNNVLTAIKNCIGRKNSDIVSFTIRGISFSFPAETLKLVDYNWQISHDYTTDSTTAWNVSLVLGHRADGWHDLSLENSGYYDVNGNVFKDKDGNPRSQPTLLTNTGTELASGATATPLTFDCKAPAAFAGLFNGF